MSAPVIPTLIFRDNFTGTDGVAISARSPDTGANWSFITGYDGATRISSNAARAENANQSPAYSSAITTTASTYRVLARLQVPATLTNSCYCYLFFESVRDGASPYSMGMNVTATGVAVWVEGSRYGALGGSFFAENTTAVSAGTTVDLVLTVNSATKESWLFLGSTLIDYRVNTGSEPALPTYITMYMDAPGVVTDGIKVDLVEVHTGTPEYLWEASTSTTASATGWLIGDATGTVTGIAPAAFTQSQPIATQAYVWTENNTDVAGLITDIADGASLLGRFIKSGSSPHATPLIAFDTWATELGLGTGGVTNFTISDGWLGRSIPTPFGTGRQTLINSEAGIAWTKDFRPGDGDSAASAVTALDGSQFSLAKTYFTRFAPNLMLTFGAPGADAMHSTGKYTNTASVGLLYAKWFWAPNYNTTAQVEAALRIEAGRVEIVALKSSGSTDAAYFQVLRTNRTRKPALYSSAAAGGGAYSDALAAGTAQHYIGEEVDPGIVTGFQSGAFGTPLFNGNSIRFATGSAFGAFGTPTVDYDPPTISTVIFEDNFTAANSTQIQDRAPDSGSYWENSLGGYDSAGRFTIFSNAAGNSNGVNYPGWNVDIPIAGSAYRVKIAFKLAATLADADITLLLEKTVNGQSPYKIECTTDTNYVGVRLVGATGGSAADYFATPYYSDDSSAAGTTIVAELIVENLASWFYIDGVLHDYRLRATQGEAPGYLNLAAANTNISVDYIQTFGNGFAYTTQGFRSTQLGSHVAFWDQFGTVSGLAPATQFGTPQFVGKVSGFQPTTFGTPYGSTSGMTTSLGEITQFGTPLTAVDATCVVDAFNAVLTRFGTPGALKIAPPAGWPFIVYAQGVLVTTFGNPAAAYLLIGNATGGAAATTFGSPGSLNAYGPTGFASTSFGTPVGAKVQVASGFQTGARGTPTRLVGQTVTGFSSTRFGQARAVRPTSYPAAGFRRTNFGRPTGYERFNYLVTSSAPTTTFGAVLALEAHKVFHIPPGTRFGEPLLSRGATC